MSGSRTERLVKACADGDRLTIAREGWNEPWQLLAEIAAPKQGCTIKELAPYARFLGDEEPAAIVEAILGTAGEWRPTPGALRGFLNAKVADRMRVDVGRGRDRTSTPEAAAAVARALEAGETACQCGAPTMRKWRYARDGVLRCPDCDGLEVGQVFAAEDLELAGESKAAQG